MNLGRPVSSSTITLSKDGSALIIDGTLATWLSSNQDKIGSSRLLITTKNKYQQKQNNSIIPGFN